MTCEYCGCETDSRACAKCQKKADEAVVRGECLLPQGWLIPTPELREALINGTKKPEDYELTWDDIQGVTPNMVKPDV